MDTSTELRDIYTRQPLEDLLQDDRVFHLLIVSTIGACLINLFNIYVPLIVLNYAIYAMLIAFGYKIGYAISQCKIKQHSAEIEASYSKIKEIRRCLDETTHN
ncbi:uncharacterized protein LOC143058926 [Mytilus galloprovincialis]|uniref:uncharacterized protein LOC143058926 n=1 Tax=Mytilus galloprovincialis TaxID=29158 RepID=UPI003F7B69D2